MLVAYRQLYAPRVLFSLPLAIQVTTLVATFEQYIVASTCPVFAPQSGGSDFVPGSKVCRAVQFATRRSQVQRVQVMRKQGRSVPRAVSAVLSENSPRLPRSCASFSPFASCAAAIVPRR